MADKSQGYIYNQTADFVLEKAPSRCDWSLLLRGAARVSFVVAGLVLAACAERDSHTAKYSAACSMDHTIPLLITVATEPMPASAIPTPAGAVPGAAPTGSVQVADPNSLSRADFARVRLKPKKEKPHRSRAELTDTRRDPEGRPRHRIGQRFAVGG
jgi:hypothetical protein